MLGLEAQMLELRAQMLGPDSYEEPFVELVPHARVESLLYCIT